MTHDELLKKINTIFLYKDEDKNEENPYLNLDFLLYQHQALRAVMELHKPDDYCCPVCGPSLDICGVEYPCPTIQAIEKELLK